MLVAYALTRNGPERREGFALGAEGDVRWADLLSPTAGEEAGVEAFLGVEIPTREEAQEIEFSSRLYAEDGALFMTVSVLAGFDAGTPALTPVTFVLAKDRIATIRYEEFTAFRQFMARSGKAESGCTDATGVFLTLTEAIIDRTADVVEKLSAEIDRMNGEVFRARTMRRRERRLETIIEEIGRTGDSISKARESLASLERMLQFASAARSDFLIGRKANDSRIKLMIRDVRSLADQLTFLSNKTTFLLDATLGLISVDQNEVIRVLTIVATFFFPPTLIGTIYGMNFRNMPELDWPFGYPLALVLMALSAILPYLYFKRRGWF